MAFGQHSWERLVAHALQPNCIYDLFNIYNVGINTNLASAKREMPTGVPNGNFILIASFAQLPSIWKNYDFCVLQVSD